jgi:hypothetical protein
MTIAFGSFNDSNVLMQFFEVVSRNSVRELFLDELIAIFHPEGLILPHLLSCIAFAVEGTSRPGGTLLHLRQPRLVNNPR